MSKLLLPSLCRANVAILSQKLSLLDALITKHGVENAQTLFTKACPIVEASIGQHFRHSMDHIELATLVVSTINPPREPTKLEEIVDIHYDLRVRGGTLEKDLEESKKRIISVQKELNDILLANPSSSSTIEKEPVRACFFLSANNDNAEENESKLLSTVGRELGFAAHHAIHHMAMVKIIALHSAGLTPGELPHEFGKAPSTIQYETSID